MSLINLENPESNAKTELAAAAMQLMPKGVVNFVNLRQCTPIDEVVKNLGLAETLSLVLLLIKNFCHSINVVRNMNEDQAMECAVYLVDEAKDFTFEDYVIMFAKAKRGQLGTIMDHVDIQVIGSMHQEYLRLRMAAFKQIKDQDHKREMDKRREEFNNQDEQQRAQTDEAMKIIKDLAYSFTKHLREPVGEALKQSFKENDEKIIALVEFDGERGIAPDRHMREFYLKAIQRRKND